MLSEKSISELMINVDLLKKLDVSEGCCCYCGRKMTKIKDHRFQFTIDHIIAKSNGGSNHAFNRVPCCRTCNYLKADNSLEYFLFRVEQCLHINIGGSKNSLKRWRHTHSCITEIILLIDNYKKEIFSYKRRPSTFN